MLIICITVWAFAVVENWHICHDTVADGVKKRVITLIDVRKPEEIDALGFIPTAHNIPGSNYSI